MIALAVDGAALRGREDLFGRLEPLIPTGCGHNLDALYDLLTEPGEPVLLTLVHPEGLEGSLGGYGGSLLRMLRDAQSHGRLRMLPVEEGSPLMVRSAVEADLPAVAAIYEHIHAQEALGLTHTGWLPGVYPVADTARQALERGDLFVGLDREERVVASGILNQVQVDVYAQGHWQFPARDEQVFVLHTLTVEPAAGRRGLGRAFVHFYEAAGRALGCTVLRIDTNQTNTAARALYRSLGFHELGAVPCDFNGIPGIRLVLLEKSLF